MIFADKPKRMIVIGIENTFLITCDEQNKHIGFALLQTFRKSKAIRIRHIDIKQDRVGKTFIPFVQKLFVILKQK